MLKRLDGAQRPNVRLGSLADIVQRQRHVRFTSDVDIRRCRWNVRKVPIADIPVGDGGPDFLDRGFDSRPRTMGIHQKRVRLPAGGLS